MSIYWPKSANISIKKRVRMEKVRWLWFLQIYKVWENKGTPSIYSFLAIWTEKPINSKILDHPSSRGPGPTLNIIFWFVFFKSECFHIWAFANPEGQIYWEGSRTLLDRLNIFILTINGVNFYQLSLQTCSGNIQTWEMMKYSPANHINLFHVARYPLGEPSK